MNIWVLCSNIEEVLSSLIYLVNNGAQLIYFGYTPEGICKLCPEARAIRIIKSGIIEVYSREDANDNDCIIFASDGNLDGEIESIGPDWLCDSVKFKPKTLKASLKIRFIETIH